MNAIIDHRLALVPALLLMAPAYAQSGQDRDNPRSATQEPSTTKQFVSTDKIIGAAVVLNTRSLSDVGRDTMGERDGDTRKVATAPHTEFGKVENAIVNIESGEVKMLLVSTGAVIGLDGEDGSPGNSMGWNPSESRITIAEQIGSSSDRAMRGMKEASSRAGMGSKLHGKKKGPTCYMTIEQLRSADVLPLSGDDSLGSVDELWLDVTANSVGYVALTVGSTLGLGGKTCYIPWDAVNIDWSDAKEPKVRVNLDKGRIESAPTPGDNQDLNDSTFRSSVDSHFKSANTGTDSQRNTGSGRTTDPERNGDREGLRRR